MTEEKALEQEVISQPIDQEEMLPKSRVEELVKKAKLKGRDQMQAELEALKAENEALKKNNAESNQPSNSNGSMGGMTAPLDPNEIAQKIMGDLKKEMQAAAEKRAQEELEREGQRIADAYKAKMAQGKEIYQDFDDVMADFNPAAFPNLVYLANQVDNTPHVMYELMKNPSKWATIAVLSERDPNAAQNMIARISASIKANEQAKLEEKEVPPPLTRLSSSPTGQDNGKLTIRDYKKMFRG